MKAVLYANILTVIGQLFAFFASTRKRKDEILRIQIFSMLLMAAASFLLKGYSAIVMDGIAISRNLMSIFSLSFPYQTYVFIAIAVVFGVMFNNFGFLGLLPLVANVTQSIVVLNNKASLKQLQFMFAFVSFCWAIYNLVIRSYAGAAFDFINMCSFLYNGMRNKEK